MKPGMDMETCLQSALHRPAAELTVTDVYDIAAGLGQDLERIIDRFGCESLVGLVPKVVRVLEQLEALVSRGQESEELRRELDRLRQERDDRQEQERRHQTELEQVDDMWRGEVKDLMSQISHLQAENNRLLVSVSLQESPITEEDSQKQEGMWEKERQAMKKLKDIVDKQRGEIRAKDHQLTLRNEDIEALQMQQQRLIRINQDLRRRIGAVEAQSKALIQRRAELEAAAQLQNQELVALHQEVRRLKKEHQDWELEREITEIEECSLIRSRLSPSASLQTKSFAETPVKANKTNSVWAECRGDAGFLAKCFEHEERLTLLPRSAKTENEHEGEDEDEDTAALLGETKSPTEEESDEEADKPHFTLQELRDVLQERNELKSQVFLLQEELAYYKSEELEEEAVGTPPSPPLASAPADQPESGIRHLIFTAIMPMVAAGLIADDPTLLPIRRLISLVQP
ncbi:RILP-like protein 1 [Thalassophryne amazonica]|uniref:RILP-like protein 1 n=1 Tax=Thalassophryne amazonica TaxID=390379 RepID=UPI001471DAED|nr:RILP-like protein 1 [Thalassophryne amazonica]